MTPSADDIQTLQKRLSDTQTLVQAIQASLKEARIQNPNQAEARSPRHPSFSQPKLIEEDGESVEISVKPKRRCESIDSRKTGHSTMLDGVRQRVTSVDYSDDSSDSDEAESFFAQEPLPEESFDEEGLR